MRQRCTNPRNGNFRNYGGRGITVCARWNKFENFLRDMGERPKGMTLDRKDSNKGYSKSNCRWSTSVEQNRNRRVVRMITYSGKTQCIVEWARDVGIPYGTLYDRIRRGWSIPRALGGV